MKPLVTCLCPTYGRRLLLGESIRCFLDQDYDNKEMIILNDQEGVMLKINNCPDNIKIFNHPTRFSSLGEKRNYLKSLGKGDYFCIWDDDDLYVPYRLSESVYFMEQYKDYDIIKIQDVILSINNKEYKFAMNRFSTQAIIRGSYIKENNYPLISIAEDEVFERKARIKIIEMFPNFWTVYRWGMNTYHVSQIPVNLEKESWDKASKHADNMRGEVVIEPEFQKDHWKDVHDFLNSVNPNLGKEWYKKIGKKC